jgi:hypothetical protein
LPIEGATAPEEGGKGSELGELERSIGSWSYSEGGLRASSHVFVSFLYEHPCWTHLHFPEESQMGGRQEVEASDAIPKKRAIQSIQAAKLFPISCNLCKIRLICITISLSKNSAISLVDNPSR